METRKEEEEPAGDLTALETMTLVQPTFEMMSHSDWGRSRKMAALQLVLMRRVEEQVEEITAEAREVLRQNLPRTKR